MQTNLQNRDRLNQAELVLGLATAAPHNDADRRRKLAASDDLLNQIEELRLADCEVLPSSLRNRIAAFASAVGFSRPITRLISLGSAHDFVLDLQQPLMSANPAVPQPRSHPRCVEGQAVTVRVTDNAAWKLLPLPTVPGAGPDGDWFVMAAETIERAWHRWAWAQHHAIVAARSRVRAEAAVRRAIVAWANYWSLCEEVDRIRGLQT